MGDSYSAPWTAPEFKREDVITKYERDQGKIDYSAPEFDIPDYDPFVENYKPIPLEDTNRAADRLKNEQKFQEATENNKIRKTRIDVVNENFKRITDQLDAEDNQTAQIQALNRRNNDTESREGSRRSARYGRSSGTILTSPLGLPSTQGIGAGKTVLGS